MSIFNGLVIKLKFILLMILIGVEVVAYYVVYNYLIYDKFLTESESIIDNLREGRTQSYYIGLFDIFKPLMIFASLPLLKFINMLNKSDIFYSKSIFMSIISQIAITITYAGMITQNGEYLYLPISLTSFMCMNFLRFIFLLIYISWNNSKIDEFPPYPLFYRFGSHENYVFKNLYLRKIQKSKLKK